MSFGNRGQRDRKYRSQIEAARPKKREPEPVKRAVSPLLMVQLGALLIGGLAVLLFPGLLTTTANSVAAPTNNPTRLPNPGLMSPANYSNLVAAYMTNPDGSAQVSEIDRAINGQCYRLSRHKIANLNTVPDDRIGENLPVRLAMQFDDMRSYLACSARISPERFCQSFYRGRLVERLRGYLGARSAEMSRRRDLLKDPNATPMRNSYMRAQAEFSGEPMKGIEASIENLSVVPDDLAGALFFLSDKGYLSASDFGFLGRNSIPQGVRNYIVEKPSENACG